MDDTIGMRLAAEPDIDAIARFQTECWREAYANLVSPEYFARVTASDRAQRWRHRLLSGGRCIVIAETVHIVGVVSWSQDELNSLYVAASHRGTGLAHRLMQTAVGDGPAHLWVFADNSRAHAFYRKEGFSPDARSMTDPDTGLLMQRFVR